MKLRNLTPLPAFAFRQFDKAGALDCVVALRATCEHVQGSTAAFRSVQEPFLWEDVYEGDPHATPLLHQGDLVPGKPGADVTFLGKSYAPGGAAKAWTCRLSVGPVERRLHVTGPRRWQPVRGRSLLGGEDPRSRVAGWALSEPEAVTAVPMDWRQAYGGAVPGSGEDGPAEVDPRNPLGCGIAGPREVWVDAPRPAPQILADPEPPAWDAAPEPACLAPVPPFWRQRQQHAGTYDDAWLEARHPLLPTDFDPRFWQCAPPGQVTDAALEGAAYRLENLHPEHAVAEGRLPDLTLAVRAEVGDAAEWHLMRLDGVQFDWRQDGRILLNWRARFPLAEAAGAMLTLDRVSLVSADEAEGAA